MIDSGEFKATRNTVLVLDEASQIGPRPLLKLFELQAKTGMTIKMLGDREQAQAIEAGDSIEILRRALPPEALPELLTTMRQATQRGREIAGLFREGEAAQALNMKRADGHAMMVGGDRDQVVAQIADLYIARRDILMGSGSKRGITVSAPTNEDVAEISRAIRQRLKARGEIGGGRDAPPGNRSEGPGIRPGPCRRRSGAAVPAHLGHGRRAASSRSAITAMSWRSWRRSNWGLRIRTKEGEVAESSGAALPTAKTGRLMLGFGHALTIDAAQGITSDEHINALPRGTSGVTAFTTYVAESRSRGATWTVISEGALFEAERHRQALGDITPITKEDLWARAAEDMSEKPYKALGIDLLGQAVRDREAAIDTFIECHQAMKSAVLADPEAGPKAFRRLRAAAVNETLGRHLTALDTAIAANTTLARDAAKGAEAAAHLAELRARARVAAQQMERAAAARRARAAVSWSVSHDRGYITLSCPICRLRPIDLRPGGAQSPQAAFGRRTTRSGGSPRRHDLT